MKGICRDEWKGKKKEKRDERKEKRKIENTKWSGRQEIKEKETNVRISKDRIMKKRMERKKEGKQGREKGKTENREERMEHEAKNEGKTDIRRKNNKERRE